MTAASAPRPLGRRFYVARYEWEAAVGDFTRRRVEGPYTHREARAVALRYHKIGFTHGRLGIAVDAPDGYEFMPKFPGVPVLALNGRPASAEVVA